MNKIMYLLAGLLLFQVQSNVLAVGTALTDGMGNTADFADYRTGGNGNLHLVWHDVNVDNGAIMYMLFNAAGDILIDRTQVNIGGTGNASTWPSVNIDAAGLVYVVWHDTTDGEVYFMRLNPSLAPLDGTSTTAATINETGDVRLSAGGGSNALHPRIRRDSNTDFHVVWESSNGGAVQYVKVDADGVILNGPLSLGGASTGADLPDVDVDTSNNVHIVFGNDVGTTANEIYYAMIDGAAGTFLIAPTLLSVDDGLRAGNVTVNVDRFDDTLYLVFKQALAAGVNGVEEVFLARLNPALDDQDGSAGDPAVLKLFEKKITTGPGVFQWSVFSRITSDKRIHATYIDFDQGACPGAGNYTINDTHVTFAGDVILREVLTTTGFATSCFPQARSAPAGNRIVWTDSMTLPSEIYASVISRADSGSSGFISCSLGNPDSDGWRAGELWLLLGLLSLLFARRQLRRAC